MSVHIFAPGEHDEFICGHILKGLSPSGEITHSEDAEGNVTVSFPGIDEGVVMAAIATYVRDEYENVQDARELVGIEDTRMAAISLLHKGVITKQQFEDVTGQPYTYGVNYPAPF